MIDYQTEFSRALGLTEHYDDLEDLTTEKLDVNAKLRKEAIWKVSSGYFSVSHCTGSQNGDKS